MIKIGMLIGDRYEIIEKIGTGGMSDVYKAKCHKLNRFVAIKVLKQEFSENTNFVSKFRIEAQAAAGLMHPNIVNVYDVGEENGIYYIVMELVDGITLKKYIEKKARLSVKEAISIAIQVSMGIEAAHNNKIIHRDIKPQNIIISKEGKVKVTDFGIAKAATSNTITSNVMGSVHYTSPEQARGGYSDEKSDIYSMGITMFEMLTGRVPFNGETTVAIAIKHIQEPMPSPREYVPEIPISVEQIVMKATQKSPDRRYQTMNELIEDLKRSLISPDEAFVKIPDPDNEGGTKVVSDAEFSQIKKNVAIDPGTQGLRLSETEKMLRQKSAEKALRAETGQMEGTGRILSKITGRTGDIAINDEDGEEGEEEFDPKTEKMTTILVISAAVIVGLFILVLVAKWAGIFGSGADTSADTTTTDATTSTDDTKDTTTDSTTDTTTSVQMEDVIGMSLEDATKLLKDKGLFVKAKYEPSDIYEKGLVINSDILPGENVDSGATITLTVSSGTDGVEVPDIIGDTSAEAISKLEYEGFTVNKTEAYSNTVTQGNVISQSPEAGQVAPKASAITIIVSKGVEEVKARIPNVIGKSDTDAQTAITDLGLNCTWGDPVYDKTIAEGLVCYQSYPEGSYVDAGVAVTLKISKGPEVATYAYSGSVTKPTDSGYTDGTVVSVKLLGSDGTELWKQTSVTSFPVSINLSGIKGITGGKVTLTYNVTVYTVDTNTGLSTTSTKEVSESRDVTFTKE